MLQKIQQTVTFIASPQEVYQTLMDSKLHQKFTGEKAKISSKVGGEFTAYGDYIEGVNVELIEGKKIVQQWRGSDWPKGYYSLVTYVLEKKGTGTKVIFTQTGVPKEQYSSIKQGWKDYYWAPMKPIKEESITFT